MTVEQAIFRLKQLIPRGWLPDAAPVATAVLSSFAVIATAAHELLMYVNAQSRIKTASDGWLDLIAYDFFGLRFRRQARESDTRFANRIINEIIRPRATREAVRRVIADLTGKPPYLYFEPANPRDTGGYGRLGGMGYAMGGRYGSLALPHQAFVIPLKPAGDGIPGVQGYRPSGAGTRVVQPDPDAVARNYAVLGVPAGTGRSVVAHQGRSIGAYGSGSIRYAQLRDVTGVVTDQDIYAAIESVRPAGCIVWVSPHTIPPEAFLNQSTTLDASTLR